MLEFGQRSSKSVQRKQRKGRAGAQAESERERANAALATSPEAGFVPGALSSPSKGNEEKGGTRHPVENAPLTRLSKSKAGGRDF